MNRSPHTLRQDTQNRTPEPLGLNADGICLCAGAVAEVLRADAAARGDGSPLLTSEGRSRFRKMARQHRGRPTGTQPQDRGDVLAVAELPFWDEASRRLWLGEVLVRSFRQHAPHQFLILGTFQRLRWQVRHIDDPLGADISPTLEAGAPTRLAATIKNLNRRLREGTIRFRGDGTGRGVCWEYAPGPAGPAGEATPQATP